jgi:transcription-repair coupling factor (superfamily II helicase)
MTPDAIKRLEAIESLEDLGAGFYAGHTIWRFAVRVVLGDEQSGQIQEIGFALYMEMLERAVDALKQGKIPQLDEPLYRGPEVDLRVPALLRRLMPDVHMRLVLYKRIAAVESVEALRELQVEMIDRFGLTEPSKNLFRIAELKLRAKAIGIRKLDLHANGGYAVFDKDANIDRPTDPVHQRNGRTINSMDRRKCVHTATGRYRARFKAAEDLLDGITHAPPPSRQPPLPRVAEIESCTIASIHCSRPVQIRCAT